MSHGDGCGWQGRHQHLADHDQRGMPPPQRLRRSGRSALSAGQAITFGASDSVGRYCIGCQRIQLDGCVSPRFAYSPCARACQRCHQWDYTPPVMGIPRRSLRPYPFDGHRLLRIADDGDAGRYAAEGSRHDFEQHPGDAGSPGRRAARHAVLVHWCCRRSTDARGGFAADDSAARHICLVRGRTAAPGARRSRRRRRTRP